MAEACGNRLYSSIPPYGIRGFREVNFPVTPWVTFLRAFLASTSPSQGLALLSAQTGLMVDGAHDGYGKIAGVKRHANPEAPNGGDH